MIRGSRPVPQRDRTERRHACSPPPRSPRAFPPRTWTGPGAFYAETLGLEPSEERPGGLLYTPAGGGEFALFTSAGAPSGTHTQMGFEVDDIEAFAAHLRERGVTLEVDDITEVEGNYPSKGGRGERADLVPRQRGQPPGRGAGAVGGGLRSGPRY